MPRLLRLSIILLFASLLGACTTFQVGHDFDVGAFATRIQAGQTTQADVRGWLGEPSGVGVSVESDGERLDQWTYYYAEGNMSKMSETRMKILQVKFDKQGKVRSYNWSNSR